MKKILILAIISTLISPIGSVEAYAPATNMGTIETFRAGSPIHIMGGTTAGPAGLFPSQVKLAYGLPKTGGKGTIAIISAFHHPDIEKDIGIFDETFGLATCTVKNKCLEIHRMSSSAKTDTGWSLETALDTEWSHAIAPKAKILVVEAASAGGKELMDAVDYAEKRKDVVSVSMSWGGDEFSGETSLDDHFTADHPISFFASSGDDGAGPSWPAVSPNVIAVGGTSLNLGPDGNLISEKAWSGSGGGVSAYEDEPAYERGYSIPRANGKRAIPDVAYAADPVHGFSVYHSGSWYVVGGTSAGAPQWAAIASLGYTAKRPLSSDILYRDKSSTDSTSFFRDIKSGSNGDCGYYCSARAHYDYVTGLGSPMTYRF